MVMKSINPSNGQLINEFDTLNNNDLHSIIKETGFMFESWSKDTTLEKRCALLKNAAKVLKDDSQLLAELITLEMGKTIAEALSEISKCASICEFYADNANSFLQDEIIETEAYKSFVSLSPLGVILGIMPWNYPFWQVFRFIAPTLVSGNTVVLKHASNVPQCALAIEEVFRKAGFPDNVYSNLMISASQVEQVIKNPVIKAISLTGSESAGRKVASVAGSELKKCVLELGGSDAFIISETANMQKTVKNAVLGRFQNMGQSCIAAKRFIVDQTIADKFIHEFKTSIESYFVAGNPMDATTTLAPMARQDLLNELHEQVMESVKLGAKIITGGYQLKREGCYYAPTILANVSSNMPAYHEELFGPVAIVIKASEPAHALGIANSSRYGLAGSIWTDDISTGETMARNLDSGAAFVNHISFSNAKMPFGGVKDSGYGRELSYYGLKEFCNIKSIWIDK